MFKKQLSIKFADCDGAGIIYFSRVYENAHAAFEDFLSENDFYDFYFRNPDRIYPIVYSDSNYLSPITFGNKIEICLSLKNRKESSFSLEYEFFLNNKLACIVTTVHVCVDKLTMKKCKLNDEFLAILELLK